MRLPRQQSCPLDKLRTSLAITGKNQRNQRNLRLNKIDFSATLEMTK
ncbi:MAG: hypothetical protein KAS69_03640 [Planctomycetes bacterium]|nr:hypothetical protein [Planctomycetota bacterium]